DEWLPAFSPDGRSIAFVTKRGEDPDRSMDWNLWVVEAKDGGAERQVTRYEGADDNPDWETRPAWSPDGTRIAYLRSDYAKWIDYSPWQLAVADVATGRETVPAPIDRCFTKPRWSP